MLLDESIYKEISTVRSICNPGAKIVFVSGNFNIVHPGHLRLLNFAKGCGDRLVVGVNEDGLGNSHVPENLRLEGIKSIGVVDHAFILRDTPEKFISLLKPDIVVKGKEHELVNNPEASAVESYGGKLLFSSGEVRFSSLDLLQRELWETNFSTISKPFDFLSRHNFTCADLIEILNRFSNLKIVVIGDLIVDEFIYCEALGMSREDPTIVVSPIRNDRFIGGAGIVAAHAGGLGARVEYYTVTGADNISEYAYNRLKEYGVKSELFTDDSRPTTLKQRYQAEDKTLLRISHLRQHDISSKLADKIIASASNALTDADLLIFSDFNYGCLPQKVVDTIIEKAKSMPLIMVADSQASSQVSDVSRFKHMTLLTPTEYEARLAMRDFTSGLVILAETLRQKALSKQVVLTLGKEGLLIHAPECEGGKYLTDRLPAFNTASKNVSGAGDSLLTTSAMALASGSDIWQSVYLGSVAAACQVARVGNSPLMAEELTTELSR